jgi:hypothetical protein
MHIAKKEKEKETKKKESRHIILELATTIQPPP